MADKVLVDREAIERLRREYENTDPTGCAYDLYQAAAGVLDASGATVGNNRKWVGIDRDVAERLGGYAWACFAAGEAKRGREDQAAVIEALASCGVTSGATPTEKRPAFTPDYERLAVDANGYVWRVYGGNWSMAPVNPDNSPIPHPVTFYSPEAAAGASPVPEQPAVTGETSDGYHTFNELYEFRMLYNAALFNEWAEAGKYDVHKSWRHWDGEECFGGGWFVVMAQLPTGQISNHYEEQHWSLFEVPVRGAAAEWDGHTAADVADRLRLAVGAHHHAWSSSQASPSIQVCDDCDTFRVAEQPAVQPQTEEQ